MRNLVCCDVLSVLISVRYCILLFIRDKLVVSFLFNGVVVLVFGIFSIENEDDCVWFGN